jgi:hypothetical protein
METIKQLLLALGLLGSPVDHPHEPCLGTASPRPQSSGSLNISRGTAPLYIKTLPAILR